MLTAGGVIEAARDVHPAFDERRTPPRVLLRFLSRHVRELHGKVAAIDETALATEQSVAVWPLADHEAGITLTDGHRYVAGIVGGVRGSDRTHEIDLIPWATRNDRNSPRRAGWVVGNTLHLRGPANLWQGYDRLALLLVATPVELTSPDDELALPDAAESALVAATAKFMAMRGHADPKLPPIPVGELASEAERAESDYLRDVANRLTGVVTRTRDVWP